VKNQLTTQILEVGHEDFLGCQNIMDFLWLSLCGLP